MPKEAEILIKKDDLIAELECFLSVLRDDCEDEELSQSSIDDLLQISGSKFQFMTSIYRSVIERERREYPGDRRLFEILREK